MSLKNLIGLLAIVLSVVPAHAAKLVLSEDFHAGLPKDWPQPFGVIQTVADPLNPSRHVLQAAPTGLNGIYIPLGLRDFRIELEMYCDPAAPKQLINFNVGDAEAKRNATSTWGMVCDTRLDAMSFSGSNAGKRTFAYGGATARRQMPAKAEWRRFALEKRGRDVVVELDGKRATRAGAAPAESQTSIAKYCYIYMLPGARVANVQVFDLADEIGKEPAGLIGRYYPSLHKVASIAYANAPDVASADIVLRDAGGKELARKNGVPLATHEIGDQVWTPEEFLFDVPDLPDGTYTLGLIARNAAGASRECALQTIERKHFPWENNKLGITGKIYPPFEPVRVNGSDVSVVMRQYRQDGLGLWSSVRARTNDTPDLRELLAGPITLKANDGQVLTGQGKFTSESPQAAVYEASAATPAVSVHTRCSTEIDGVMKVELTLEPGKDRQPLNSLWLDIPLKESEVPFFHVVSTDIRANPAGKLPAGTGDVWDSRQFVSSRARFWYGNFLPYIWLGGPERGLCWFADNDKGWELNVDDANPSDRKLQTPCLVIHRENGVVTLRVNLVQKPVTLTEPRTIVFGLMASPAKPMPKDWRRLTWTYKVKGVPQIGWMGSEYWGSDGYFNGKYPRNHDLSVLDAMRDARLGKKIDAEAFAKEWVERNYPPGAPVAQHGAEANQNLVKIAVSWPASAPAGDYYNVYWEEFSTCWIYPEVTAFGGEWGPTSQLAPSYIDFATWWGAEFIKRGIGLYFDNSFPQDARDTLTTSAYVLPNGRIQPSAGIWARRDYLRRIWTLHQELGPKDIKPLMMAHMTNGNVLPYLAWNESNLDLEWRYGPQIQQSKYSPDLLLTETTGLQSGNIPLALARIDSVKDKKDLPRIERSKFGVMMVHEAKTEGDEVSVKLMRLLLDFGYGLPDCQVFNYWSENNPVKVSNGQVKTLTLRKGNEVLVMLVTWNPQPETVTLTYNERDAGGLAKPRVLKDATDAETGESLTSQAEALSVPLEGYGVRFVHFTLVTPVTP